MTIPIIDLLGLTYLIGLLYKVVESSRIMAKYQGTVGAKVFSVMVFSVCWPFELLIIAWLRRRGDLP